MEIRDSRRLGRQKYCLVAQLRRVRLLENKEGAPAAVGARRLIAHAQNERLGRSESGSDAYAPAVLEKPATASASVLYTSKTVSNFVICTASWHLLPRWQRRMDAPWVFTL